MFIKKGVISPEPQILGTQKIDVEAEELYRPQKNLSQIPESLGMDFLTSTVGAYPKA
jgi:hypothetical protein